MMESELSQFWKVSFPWKAGFPGVLGKCAFLGKLGFRACLGKSGFPYHAKDQKRRLTDAKMVLLSKFKSALVTYSDEDIAVFKVRVGDVLTAKKKEEFDRAVAQSRDAQAAAPRGLLSRVLG